MVQICCLRYCNETLVVVCHTEVTLGHNEKSYTEPVATLVGTSTSKQVRDAVGLAS